MDYTLIRVLMIEDDEDDYVMTRDMLSDIEGTRYSLEWVSDSAAACEKMTGGDFDVCLLDYRLGSESGIDILRKCTEKGSRLPVIMLTGQDDREIDVEAMNAGASDYLVKGKINGALLERAIRYAIERKRSEAEKENLIAELKQTLAEVSTLSGLLPICSGCKKIRDDKGYWEQVEVYIEHKSGCQFSHGLCPECAEALYPKYFKNKD